MRRELMISAAQFMMILVAVVLAVGLLGVIASQ
jgi:hypothetical protein